MASELAVAYVSLLPSTRNFGSNLERQIAGPSAAAGRSSGKRFGDEFSRQASKSTSGLKSTLGSLAKGTGLVAVSAIAAGAGLAAMGIKAAASLETTRTSFASLLGSTKAANVEIAKLQKYAAKTPFSQSDVFGYAQQYYSLADSIGMSKAQLTPFLNAVGNLGAVTGASTEGIHNAVMAIGQIGSRGKVTLDNLNQISQAFPGFNGAAAIASATGQTTAQVMNQISKGTLDAKTGVQALIKGMQQFKGASGAMAKQSQTLNGVFSTFKDTVSIQLTKAFTPLIPVVKKTLGQLTPVIAGTLKQVAPAIAAFAKDLAPVLGPLVQGLGQAVGVIFKALGPVLKALAPLVKPLANAFARLVKALSPLLTFIAEIVGQLGPPLVAIFNALVSALAPVVKAFVHALAPVLPIIAQSIGNLLTALQPVIDALSGAFIQVINAIAPELPGLATSFGDMSVALANLLVPLTPLLGLFTRLAVNILPPLVKVFTGLADTVTWVVNHVVGPLLHHLLDIFLDVVGGIVKAADSMFGWVPFVGGKLDDAAHAVDHFKDQVDNSFSNLNKNAVFRPQIDTGPLAAQANAAINNILNPMVQYANDIMSNIGQSGTGLLTSLLPGQSKTPRRIVWPKIPVVDTPIFNPTPIDTSSGGGGGGSKGSAGSKSKPPKPPKFDRSTLAGLARTLFGGSAADIRAAIKSITKSIRESKHVVPAYVATEGAQLEKMAKHRTEISKRLDAANTALQNVQAKYNAIFTGVRSAFRGAFDISSAGTGPSGAARVTTGRIMAQLRQTANRAVAFGSLLKKLAREGLPSGLLSQLAQAGPQALAQAQALAKATPGQLAGIKADFSRLTNAGQQSGKFLADDLYGAGVKSAKGLRDGLRSQKSALTDAIKELGEAMIRQLKRTLKIHSPSRVTHEIGQFLGLGLEHGIASKYGDVSRAADGLANASRPKLASVRGGGSSAVTFSDVDIDRLAAAVASRPVTLVAKGRHLADVVLAETDVLAVQMKTAERSGLARGGVR